VTESAEQDKALEVIVAESYRILTADTYPLRARVRLPASPTD
jgi:hypothetical protein